MAPQESEGLAAGRRSESENIAGALKMSQQEESRWREILHLPERPLNRVH